MMDCEPVQSDVLTCGDIEQPSLMALLARYGMQVEWVAAGEPISGSYWGECEAGLIGNRLFLRRDTPIHSALHEACHYICMNSERRAGLHTDAGGEPAEENGVCYLQLLLADHVPDVGRSRMFADMDVWGYSFRLGSARAWFEQDAEDARQWLVQEGLIDGEAQPLWRVR
jgi:hypothetical protein